MLTDKAVSHNELKHYKLPFMAFVLTFVLLAIVQVKMSARPIILLERFLSGGGWVEILFIALYAGFITYKMQFPHHVPKWRKISWTIFCVVFFAQLIIGMAWIEKFLMTGKLHLPIPVMILAGPIYRGHLSVMTILFLSSIILTGPAWCSQFCYFGAFDNLMARGKIKNTKFKNKTALKATLLFLVILSALLLRWFNVPNFHATIIAIAFGVAGIGIILLISSRNRKMTHCTLYCPIGTLVNIMKPINPFRLYIDSSCTHCMKCTTVCRYDALHASDIEKNKPDYSCTLCGDCLASCHHNSIKYKYLKLSPENSRKLYLLLTISLHAVCLALARI